MQPKNKNNPALERLTQIPSPTTRPTPKSLEILLRDGKEISRKTKEGHNSNDSS